MTRKTRVFLPLLLLALGACDPRTTEQPGADPRIEAEVERTREALEAGPLAAPSGGAPSAVVVALVDGGELRWVRAFGPTQAGFAPERVFAVPQLLPLVQAVGLERLADQGQGAPSGPRERLALPEDGLAAALAAQLEKESGQSWRTYLEQEILKPLAMKSARLSEGEPPRLEASAEDLVRLMVDLQKAYAGRTFRRLTQASAQELLTGDGERRGLGFELGGKGQARYFLRRGSAGGVAFLFVGFLSSGNGAVVFGPSDAVVSGVAQVLERDFEWPAPPL